MKRIVLFIIMGLIFISCSKKVKSVHHAPIAQNDTNTFYEHKYLLPCARNDLDMKYNLINNDTIYHNIDEMPQFVGGETALTRYIDKKMRYPALAKSKGIQGRVIIRFVVTKKGQIGRIEIVRSINTDFDREAIRIIKTLPNFIPGKLNHKHVNVLYYFPVKFELRSNKSRTKNIQPEIRND